LAEEDTQILLQFFKVLTDKNRLKIVGLLATREQSVEEMAVALGVKAPAVLHDLEKLQSLRLVRTRLAGTTQVYSLDVDTMRQLHRHHRASTEGASMVDDAEGDAWERKVLKDFFDGTRLKEIPASKKKRLVIVKWFASLFEPEVRYREAEVNEIILRHHPDFAYIRKDLVGAGFLQREHGVYWRVP
jgi:DNA-binding transcriptional ArsR family regulator